RQRDGEVGSLHLADHELGVRAGERAHQADLVAGLGASRPRRRRLLLAGCPDDAERRQERHDDIPLPHPALPLSVPKELAKKRQHLRAARAAKGVVGNREGGSVPGRYRRSARGLATSTSFLRTVVSRATAPPEAYR